MRGIDLMRNYGQHNALLSGIRAAPPRSSSRWTTTCSTRPRRSPSCSRSWTRATTSSTARPSASSTGSCATWPRGHQDRAAERDGRRHRAQRSAPSARSAPPARGVRRLTAARSSRLDVLLTWATTRFAAVAVRASAARRSARPTTPPEAVPCAQHDHRLQHLPLQLASLVGFAFTLFGLPSSSSSSAASPSAAASPASRSWPRSSRSSPARSCSPSGVIGEYLARIHFRVDGQHKKPAYTHPTHLMSAQAQRPWRARGLILDSRFFSARRTPKAAAARLDEPALARGGALVWRGGGRSSAATSRPRRRFPTTALVGARPRRGVPGLKSTQLPRGPFAGPGPRGGDARRARGRRAAARPRAPRRVALAVRAPRTGSRPSTIEDSPASPTSTTTGVGPRALVRVALRLPAARSLRRAARSPGPRRSPRPRTCLHREELLADPRLTGHGRKGGRQGTTRTYAGPRPRWSTRRRGRRARARRRRDEHAEGYFQESNARLADQLGEGRGCTW